MASTLLTTGKDAADRDGPVPVPSSSARTSPSRRRFLEDHELDIMLRKAGLGPAPGRDPGNLEGESMVQGGAGRRTSDGVCRVGQCIMPGMFQRLATVGSFTAMCCALATLTGMTS